MQLMLTNHMGSQPASHLALRFYAGCQLTLLKHLIDWSIWFVAAECRVWRIWLRSTQRSRRSKCVTAACRGSAWKDVGTTAGWSDCPAGTTRGAFVTSTWSLMMQRPLLCWSVIIIRFLIPRAV